MLDGHDVVKYVIDFLNGVGQEHFHPTFLFQTVSNLLNSRIALTNHSRPGNLMRSFDLVFHALDAQNY